jgi:hypothetical protein
VKEGKERKGDRRKKEEAIKGEAETAVKEKGNLVETGGVIEIVEEMRKQDMEERDQGKKRKRVRED